MSQTDNEFGYSTAAEEVKRRLHVELVPGTEILGDQELTGSAHDFVHAGGRNDVVLVPQPQDDIHDPLNWSLRWKYVCLVNMAILSFLGNFTALSIAPLTPIYIEQFNVSLSKVALLTGGTILALGYANFIIIPCSNIFGRRPTVLVCAALGVACMAWGGGASSYKSLLAARVVAGIGAATSESMMPVVISDLMFLHERGTWMGIYFCSFFLGAYLGPIVSGNLGAHVTWQWFFWLGLILQTLSLVGLFLFFPETKYRREALGADLVDSSTNNEKFLEVLDVSRSSNALEEAEQIETKSNPQMGLDPELQHRKVITGQGFPSTLQRWKVIAKPDPIGIKLLPRDLLLPFQLATFPIVLFASCCLGFGANSLLVLNLLESPAFSSPPYNFSPAAVGFVNFALLGGAVVGLLTAGPFSDWVSMFFTKRNHGIREPEMRLPSFIPFVCLGIIGMTVAAVGWEKGWRWEIIVVIGFGFTGVFVMSIPTIGLTYAIDSYKPVAGEIMVVGTIVKNTYGFGMTYYINDWALKSGYVPPIMQLMALSAGTPILGMVIFHFFGKRLRRVTRNSKVHSF